MIVQGEIVQSKKMKIQGLWYIILGETFYIHWLTKKSGIPSLETELAWNIFMIEKKREISIYKVQRSFICCRWKKLFILMLGEDILSSLNITW